jgi:lambda repressor-like predicted transcriptional regulator
MTEKEVPRGISLTKAKIRAEGSSSSFAEVFWRQKQARTDLKAGVIVVVMVVWLIIWNNRYNKANN